MGWLVTCLNTLRKVHVFHLEYEWVWGWICRSSMRMCDVLLRRTDSLVVMWRGDYITEYKQVYSYSLGDKKILDFTLFT